MLKAWLLVRRRTRSSVSGSGMVACSVNHLLVTSASPAWARKNEFERAFALRAGNERQRPQRGDLVGHVGDEVELPHGDFRAQGLVAGGDQIEAGVAQGAAARMRRVGRIGLVGGQALVKREQRLREIFAEVGAEGAPRHVDGVGIDVRPDVAGYVGLAWQGQHFRGEGRIALARLDQLAQGPGEGLAEFGHLAVPDQLRRTDQQAGGESLRRLPAVERVRVMGDQQQQVGFVEIDVEHDRRRKTPQQRGRSASGPHS